MSEPNKALFRQFVEAINTKDIAVIERLLGPNFVDHDPAPNQSEGIDGIKEVMQEFFGGFSDLNVTIEQFISEGDVVAGVVTTKGTHSGDLFGMPATGKKVSMREIHVLRIADDKAVEHWGVADAMTMMAQLGMGPGQ